MKLRCDTQQLWCERVEHWPSKTKQTNLLERDDYYRPGKVVDIDKEGVLLHVEFISIEQ